jgi:hypothetical protein
MQVKFKSWRNDAEIMDLSDALTPVVYRDGQVEQAQAGADVALACIGRLAALLVESGALTLAQVSDACGIYGITPLE